MGAELRQEPRSSRKFPWPILGQAIGFLTTWRESLELVAAFAEKRKKPRPYPAAEYPYAVALLGRKNVDTSHIRI
jgi:hypothetical protein